MKLIRRLASLLLVPALLAGTAGAQTTVAPLPDAEPAMWVVKDKDTTIYLFGTFHALDGKRDWFNDEVKQAFGNDVRARGSREQGCDRIPDARAQGVADGKRALHRFVASLR